MANKKSSWSTDEKIRIVLQSFNPQIGMAEICRQYNLSPRTVYGWRERFMAGGRNSLGGSDASKQAQQHKKEIAALKRIIGEYAVANDALKKHRTRTRNHLRQRQNEKRKQYSEKYSKLGKVKFP